MIEYSVKGLQVHKNEMRMLLDATDMLGQQMPAIDEQVIETGMTRGKLLS